jgi:formylglycine-generating enzyme
MKARKWIYLLLFSLTLSLLAAQTPVVSNVSAVQRRDGSKIIDIGYDLSQSDVCTINLLISANGGESYQIIPGRDNLSGDIGKGVLSGIGKSIVWNAGNEEFSLSGASFKVQISALRESGSVNTLVYVPAATIFVNGQVYDLSAYYVDKYEVTQSSFEQVMRYNPAHGHGISPLHAVYNTTWFNAIEYCNRRSLLEGFTPCYSFGDYGSNPDEWVHTWDSANENHSMVQCNWSANGYRLLSELEWLYAARGGAESNNYTYSGSNNLGAVAWHNQNSYLLPPSDPDHGIHAVGFKAHNELGLYDMTGNVYEWCWDIYGAGGYGSQTNPHGAEAGVYRAVKGAGWKSDAYGCQLHIRCIGVPLHTGDGDFGFRVGRSAAE